MTESLETGKSKGFKDASELTSEKPTRDFVEVTIPLPWGHISGKWYGPQNVRPILGLHGWLDNAGTFDTLAPLLSPHVAFLSIDLPGHGLSSRLPDGCCYNMMDNLVVIRMIMNQYNWDKVSLIGHSMSGIIAFLFAAIFPDKTEMIISIDALKPHQRSIEKTINTLASRLEESIKEDQRNRSKIEPPSYTYEELIERLFHGSIQSVQKNNCKYLLARNIQKSEKNPEKYFFSRDRRVRFYNYAAAPQDVTVAMAKRITAPHMFIKALSSSYFEDKQYYDEVLNVLLQKSNFEYVEAEGTHHLHLNNPADIIDPINRFIDKFGPKREVLSKL
ncbi:probable serine hydrolase [Eupeodes corollae]|uniref:probable serine hydrolase n=1 Tax=Eupeodes corollae TaxID=290404 RepID=UPI0024900875|nr:probable serine hydrolase [Eupeodes corollae]XP_055914453.1 probable serine hydrolase [Eupeodes corollae]XP_055914454.1 probable serine hydrolase [Eupeodes corollae]